MARRGDGIYQRSKTWWLDFVHEGRRHVVRIGKGINRTVAGELPGAARASGARPRNLTAIRPRGSSPRPPVPVGALAHEMARKNGTRPGGFNPVFMVWTLLASLVMVAVDARRRPALASVAYGLTLFVTVSVAFARLPAFAESLPSVPETALAAAVTVLAGLAGGVLASGAVEQLERVLVRD